MSTPGSTPTAPGLGRRRTRVRHLSALLLMSFMAPCLVPAGASASGQSTPRAALRELRSYFRAIALVKLPASVQSVGTFVGSTGASCPNVLAAANLLPSTAINEGSAEAFGEESGVDIGIAFTGPDRAATTTLIAELAKLRWPTRAQSVRMRAFLAARSEYGRLQLSNLCEDARADAASGFKTTPTATLQFLAAYGRTNHGGSYLGLVQGTRGFIETGADRHVVGEIKHLEAIVESSIQGLVQAEGTNLLKALGLST